MTKNTNTGLPPAPPLQAFETTDYHTGGEPFRIVTRGTPPLPGATVGAKRANAILDPGVQRARRILCSEPRGHADMYGCFLTEPDDDGAHFGVLFWHKDGFSTACGHGTIALGAWAVETGLVPAEPDGETDVRIDVPSGRVTARVRTVGGRVESVAFINVPSWVAARGVETGLEGVTADIGFGGAFYACVPASALGLSVTPEHYAALVSAGREIKHLLDDHPAARHPEDHRLSGIYGTIIYDEPSDDAGTGRAHQRNVTIFADGEADRSPCGSGTAARLALLDDSGELAEGATLRHDSIVGSTFLGQVRERLEIPGAGGPRPAIVPEIVGMAYRTGSSAFEVDPRDPLAEGFVLR